MRWARSTFIARLVAGLLVLSMLPTLVAEAGQSSSVSAQGSYAQWILAQLRVPADSGLEKALDHASEEGATTFEGFLKAFLDAYEDQRPDVPIARIFTERDLTQDALISYLQRRYTEIAGEAVLPRLRSALAATPMSLGASGSSAVLASASATIRAYAAQNEASAMRAPVVSVHSLTSARSQAP